MRTYRLSLAMMAAAALLSACDSPSDDGRREPARLTVVSGDLQQATVGTELANPLVVRVEDDRGRPVSDQPVNVVVTAGGGSVFAGSSVTNQDGEVSARWKLGTVAGDTQRVEVRALDAATGEAKVFAAFRAVGTAGAANGLTTVGQTNLASPVGTPLPLSVKVTDAFGNPAPGAQVSWVVTAGAGQATPATSAAGADGVATTQWSLAPVIRAPQTIEARVAGHAVAFQAVANVPPDVLLEKVSGGGEVLPFRADTTAPYPDTLTLVARFRRVDGPPIGGMAFTVRELNASGQPIDNIPYPDAVSDANGLVTVRWPATKYAGFRRMSISSGTASALFSFTRQAGPPARVVATAASELALPGANVTTHARVEDALRQPLPGVDVAWTVVAGGGSVSPAASATDAAGTATTIWTTGMAGAQVLRATAGALQDTARVTVAGTINIAPRFGALWAYSQSGSGNRVRLAAEIRAPTTITSATLEFASRTLALSRSTVLGGEWWESPAIDLSEVPTGEYLAVFRATDAAGNQGYAEQRIFWTRTPVVTFTTPSAPSVTATDSVRVVVECRDPGPCGELVSELSVVTPANPRQVLFPKAGRRSEMDTWISLPQAGTYVFHAYWGYEGGAGTYTPLFGDTVTVTVPAASASPRAAGTAPRVLRFKVSPPPRSRPAPARRPTAPAPRRSQRRQ